MFSENALFAHSSVCKNGDIITYIIRAFVNSADDVAKASMILSTSIDFRIFRSIAIKSRASSLSWIIVDLNLAFTLFKAENGLSTVAEVTGIAATVAYT